ncbi:sensor histidine kinase [Variovorax sp. J22G73]|uniref:sensor histidine kinase n=1 Tax=unclassified Variovorax TaxID=663243 RepID=UPI002578C83B|nr:MULTISPECIES: sensor histidine kinase [unclassified Variovorax]MDM0005654.1 sensor histidine kinase [Variovorax sp. J22R203]MDM0099681.1 sensor histidine kinase [Variovorax sp. J22G73]
MKWLAWCLRVCGLMAAVALHAAHAAPLQLDPRASVDSRGHLRVLRDPEGRLDADEAAAATGWQAMSGAVNAGFTTDTLWVRLEVQRPADAPDRWLLQFNNALLDDVRLYRREPAGAPGHWQLMQRAGEDAGRASWPVDARNVQLPLLLENAEPTALLVRLQTKNAMSTTIGFATPEVYGRAARHEYFWYGLGFGFGFLLIAFHSLFWQMTRDRLSGWYLLYVSIALMVELLTAGIAQQMLAMPVWLSDTALGLCICCAVAIGIRFSAMQLGADVRWPVATRRVQHAVTMLCVVAAALVLSGHNGPAMFAVQSTAMLSIVCLLAAALWLLRRDQGQARAFLLIFGIYYAGVLVSFLRNMGWLPANAWTNSAAALGTLLHMLLMSTRLSRRYDQLRRDKEAAQARVMQMVGRHNDQLEEEVRRRTVDLREEIARRERLEVDLRAALETERRAKQSQLDFVAMVSHEFRTPLAIISTTAQQIARNLDAAREKTLARCMNLRGAVQRMSALVEEYLTADRMDAGHAHFQPRHCERDELMELFEDLAADWPDGRIALRTHALPARLMCDPGLLRVALRNLLVNADRHTPEGGVIGLDVVADFAGHVSGDASKDVGGTLRIGVHNPGDAIPADEVTRVFEKYFRGRKAAQSPGAGLGLYLVHRIAQLHGGDVRLDSAGEDGRVRFSVALPAGRD